MFTSIHKTTGVIKHLKTEMAMEWKQLYEQVTDGGMGSRSVSGKCHVNLCVDMPTVQKENNDWEKLYFD